jgi:hypothetical protein
VCSTVCHGHTEGAPQWHAIASSGRGDGSLFQRKAHGVLTGKGQSCHKPEEGSTWSLQVALSLPCVVVPFCLESEWLFLPAFFFFGECAGWGVASHPVVWCSRCGRLLVRCVGLYASALSHFRSCSRFCGLSLVVDGLPVRFLVLDERSLRRFVGQVLSTWSYR